MRFTISCVKVILRILMLIFWLTRNCLYITYNYMLCTCSFTDISDIPYTKVLSNIEHFKTMRHLKNLSSFQIFWKTTLRKVFANTFACNRKSTLHLDHNILLQWYSMSTSSKRHKIKVEYLYFTEDREQVSRYLSASYLIYDIRKRF